MAAVKRIQVPFSFAYPVSCFVASSTGGSPTQSATVMEPVVGTSVAITNRDTSAPATIFQQETGSATYTSVVTDAGGNVPGWVVSGSYKLAAAPQGSFTGATINWDPVRGDGVELIASGVVEPSNLDSSSTYTMAGVNAGNVVITSSTAAQETLVHSAASANAKRFILQSQGGRASLGAQNDALTIFQALNFPISSHPTVSMPFGAGVGEGLNVTQGATVSGGLVIDTFSWGGLNFAYGTLIVTAPFGNTFAAGGVTVPSLTAAVEGVVTGANVGGRVTWQSAGSGVIDLTLVMDSPSTWPGSAAISWLAWGI